MYYGHIKNMVLVSHMQFLNVLVHTSTGTSLVVNKDTSNTDI